MDQESIIPDVDPRSVPAAIKQANQAFEGWGKGTVGAGDRMQKSLERMADMLLKVNDRSRSSLAAADLRLSERSKQAQQERPSDYKSNHSFWSLAVLPCFKFLRLGNKGVSYSRCSHR